MKFLYAGIFLGMILYLLVGAFVFIQLWSWFVAPIFGCPNLNLLQGLGILLTITFLAQRERVASQPQSTSLETKEERIAYSILTLTTGILTMLISLLIGWFTHWLLGILP